MLLLDKRRPLRRGGEVVMEVKWTNVDMEQGYLSYSGRPQTVPLY